jgi:hypothetical protein
LNEGSPWNTDPEARQFAHAYLMELQLAFGCYWRVWWYWKPKDFYTTTWHMGGEREDVEERAWDAIAEGCARNGIPFDATEWVIAGVVIANGN